MIIEHFRSINYVVRGAHAHTGSLIGARDQAMRPITVAALVEAEVEGVGLGGERECCRHRSSPRMRAPTEAQHLYCELYVLVSCLARFCDKRLALGMDSPCFTPSPRSPLLWQEDSAVTNRKRVCGEN